jgi:hypothetical protein
MKFWTTPDCSCARNTAYADGTLPEHFDREADAAVAFAHWLVAESAVGHYLYWGVHLRSAHVLNVEEDQAQ